MDCVFEVAQDTFNYIPVVLSRIGRVLAGLINDKGNVRACEREVLKRTNNTTVSARIGKSRTTILTEYCIGGHGR